MTISKLLKAMLEHKASDIHLTSGSAPGFRVHGRMLKIKAKALQPSETRELAYSVLTEYQKAQFEENKELDFSFTIRDLGRFRGNMFFQRGSVACVFRHIPFHIPSMRELGLPPITEKFLSRPKGLILCTGQSGSGKTTTLASMMHELNQTKPLHILTIEDPIEYIHTHGRSIINQREVTTDTKTFATALRSALREDPDVVMVGEMRDRDTIETALMLAETGQLVFSTLHTNSASQTISRILDVFPSQDQPQVRTQLSMVLEGIVTQALIPRIDGQGRVLAAEVLVPNTSIRNIIRENKIHHIPTAMQAGQDQSGMITLNQSLMDLVRRKIIRSDQAIENSIDQDELIKWIAEWEGRRAA